MAGVNKVILIGNCGQDPEVKYTPSGDAVASVSIATSETWKDKESGEKKEKTEWHRIVFFRRLAEVVGEYVKKGSKIYVEGKLQTRKWEDKENITRYITEVIGQNMQMLDSKKGSGGPPSGAEAYSKASGGSTQGRPASESGQQNDGFDFDDDIPF